MLTGTAGQDKKSGLVVLGKGGAGISGRELVFCALGLAGRVRSSDRVLVWGLAGSFTGGFGVVV